MVARGAVLVAAVAAVVVLLAPQCVAVEGLGAEIDESTITFTIDILPDNGVRVGRMGEPHWGQGGAWLWAHQLPTDGGVAGDPDVPQDVLDHRKARDQMEDDQLRSQLDTLLADDEEPKPLPAALRTALDSQRERTHAQGSGMASDHFVPRVSTTPLYTPWMPRPKRGLGGVAEELDIANQIQRHDLDISLEVADALPESVLQPERVDSEVRVVYGGEGKQDTLPLGLVPFYGPFGASAHLNLSLVPGDYSVLHGLEPRLALEHSEFATDPDTWHDALTAPLTCASHPPSTSFSFSSSSASPTEGGSASDTDLAPRAWRPSLVAAGGDVGEFVLGMEVYEEMLMRRVDDEGKARPDGDWLVNTKYLVHLTRGDVFRVLVDYLAHSPKAAFHVCVRAEFLTGLCRRTRFCPLTTQQLMTPPQEMVSELVEAVGFEDTLPSRHLFALFNYPKYEVRQELITATVQATFGLLWNVPLDPTVSPGDMALARRKLDVCVSRVNFFQSAVLEVHVAGKCPTSLYPGVSTATPKGGNVYVVHPQAVNVHRLHMVSFLTHRFHDVQGYESEGGGDNLDYVNLPPPTVARRPVFLELGSIDNSTAALLDAEWELEETAEMQAQSEDQAQAQAQGEVDGGVDGDPLYSTAAVAGGDGKDGFTKQTSLQAIERPISFRIRDLARIHRSHTLTHYLADLPRYAAVFEPRDPADPCSFYPPFVQPFTAEGPWHQSPAPPPRAAPQPSLALPTLALTMREPVAVRSPATDNLAQVAPGMSWDDVHAFITSTFPRSRAYAIPRSPADPQQMAWHQLHHTPLQPLDGRVLESGVSVPGADMGLWIAVLATVETTTQRHFTQEELNSLFVQFVEGSVRQRFALWTDEAAVDRLCAASTACPVWDPAMADDSTEQERLARVLEHVFAPASDVLPRLYDHCADPAAVGDRFLRWLLLGYGEEFGVRAQLAEMAVRSFFAAMWNFMPRSPVHLTHHQHSALAKKLDLVVMLGEPGQEQAVVNVVADRQCRKDAVPALPSSSATARLLVHHEDASMAIRDHMLQFLVTQHPNLQPSLASLRIQNHFATRQMVRRFIRSAMDEKPRYRAEIADPECMPQ